ncbi:MAG: hypothetical protein ACREK6_09245, partial [Candidatus Rokuibacteriota bacterium]
MRLIAILLSVLLCLWLVLTARTPVFSQSSELCSVPLTITKFESAPNRFGVEPLPVLDPKTGEQVKTASFRIDWRVERKLPACLSIDRFVVRYSAHARPSLEVSVPGNTSTTVVYFPVVGTPSLPAIGRHSASVTGVIRSQLVGDLKHVFGGIPAGPSGCNQIPLTFATNFADAKLAVIKGSSSPRTSTPGGIVSKAPSASLKFDGGRGLRVAWQLGSTNQQLCATLDKFIVSAKVTLTSGAVREGSTTVAPDVPAPLVEAIIAGRRPCPAS